MKMRGLIVVVLSLCVTGAYAETPFYVGGGFGVTDIDQKLQISDLNGPVDASGDAMGLALFGGFELTPNWAFELGYIDFGSVQADFVQPIGPGRFKLDTTAAYLNVQYHIPLGDEISLDLAFGGTYGKSRASAVFDDPSIVGANFRETETEYGYMAGVGVTIKVLDIMYLRGSANYFDLTFDERAAEDVIDAPLRIGIDAIVDF